MAKKYLSKIKKNGNTIYIKDEDARGDIDQMKSSVMTAVQAEALFDSVFNNSSNNS